MANDGPDEGADPAEECPAEKQIQDQDGDEVAVTALLRQKGGEKVNTGHHQAEQKSAEKNKPIEMANVVEFGNALAPKSEDASQDNTDRAEDGFHNSSSSRCS